MLKVESVVTVADNTWAKKAKIIRILKWSTGSTATVGDSVVVAIKTAMPNGNVKKWQVIKALVVRTKKEVARKDGTYIRFGDNAVILMTKNEKWVISNCYRKIMKISLKNYYDRKN